MRFQRSFATCLAASVHVRHFFGSRLRVGSGELSLAALAVLELAPLVAVSGRGGVWHGQASCLRQGHSKRGSSEVVLLCFIRTDAGGI